MIDFKSISYFVAVAEAGGFRKASASLKILQPVLSRKIRDLEDRIGVSLFERHRDGVRLTNAGRRFLGDARSILAQIERAKAALSAAGEGGNGHLCIGLPTSISAGFLNCLVRRWRRDHPGVAITLRDGTATGLVASIVERETDVTFVSGTVPPPGCDKEVLWHEQIMLAVPADHALAARTSVELADIVSERFIVNLGGLGLELRDFLVGRMSSLGVSPCIEVFDVGRETLFTMVGLGFGCTTSASLGTGVTYPGVRYVPIHNVSFPFSAVWLAANDNPALRKFLSLARTMSRSWSQTLQGFDPPNDDRAATIGEAR